MYRRAERWAAAVFDAVTAAPLGTRATASASAPTRADATYALPPSGTAPTARAHGPTKIVSVAEHTSTAAAASPRRGTPIFAIPNTVAAIRNGITAATEW